PGLPPSALNLVVAISFSVLSLLPAVLLHVSLEDSRPVLVGAGYLLSAVAIGMHFREIAGNGEALHQTALMLITVGFLVLAGAAAVSAARSGNVGHRPGGARIVASMCLALFAMSFVHFGAGHAGEVWSSELIVHHAGIPLALFVLLQDYRFVLLDAFVRFLANALLALVLTGLGIEAAFRLLPVDKVVRNPLNEALLLAGVCLFLVLFAWLRNQVQTWLTQAVFRHGGVAGLPVRVKESPPFSTEEPYLAWAAGQIAAALGAGHFSLLNLTDVDAALSLHAPVPAAMLPALVSRKEWNWAEAVVPIRLGPGNTRLLLLGRRQGGRRYLGDDLDALGKTAAEIAERVESLRAQEMNRLVSQAELRALQSQINPHFLFNALNTLYGTIPREASAARGIVLNLADIFRYFLQSGQTFVPLTREMQIVRAYLDVEQSRLGNRLQVVVEVEDEALAVPIPVLSIQPLVENAVKHGVALHSGPGYVRVKATCRGGELRISVENSGAGAAAGSAGTAAAGSAGTGMGLQNVRRRLEICYGASSQLQLSLNLQNTVAELTIPLAAPVNGA
ncbi:MAG TPA: histidine kinase, partial [Candidatus Solibacter sp.]|nr:histidine kinase [Candidatus Solibacter sp.]